MSRITPTNKIEEIIVTYSIREMLTGAPGAPVKEAK